MKIAIGSLNPSKVAAVEAVFAGMEVEAVEAPSSVSAQPFSDTETQKGAINRAAYSLSKISADIGIGLEGGVMYVADRLYLCNWGALITHDKTKYIASGARILLPAVIEEELLQGRELGDVMADYVGRRNVRKTEGTIGVLTNEHLSRNEMFARVVNLLYGQWEYGQTIGKQRY